MSHGFVPLPSGNFIDAIRDSSKTLVQEARININYDAIERLLLSPAFTSSFHRLGKSHGFILPLNFSSTLSELNLISVLSVLNIGSGYRVPLHRHTGRGAFDSIRMFLMSIYLESTTGGDYLSARGMVLLDHQKVAEFMGLSNALHVEKAHETIPGLTVGELGGPIYDLVQLVAKVMNETGKVLQEGGYPDLGSFVLEALQQAQGDPQVILQRLVRGIPAFRDMAIVNGMPVYIFKKALLLIHIINLRFSSTSPFPIPQTSGLPVFSDNVLPSMLIHLGIIDLSGSDPALGLEKILTETRDESKLAVLLGPPPPQPLTDEKRSRHKENPKEGPVVSVNQAYVLRAAAIEACEKIQLVARTMRVDDESQDWINGISLPELDGWIWAGAKDRTDYRRLRRIVLRETEYF